MDWHANAKIKHELYAIVEGQPQQSQGIWPFQSTRSVSPISGPSRRSSNPRGGKGGSPDSTPSRSPSPDVQGMSRLALDTPSISLVRRQELPQAPSYEAAVGAQDGASWLEGTFSVNRSIRVFWNPNTSGGVDSLDDGLQGRTDPPGNYTIQLNAPLVSVFLLPANLVVDCMLHPPRSRPLSLSPAHSDHLFRPTGPAPNSHSSLAKRRRLELPGQAGSDDQADPHTLGRQAVFQIPRYQKLGPGIMERGRSGWRGLGGVCVHPQRPPAPRC